MKLQKIKLSERIIDHLIQAVLIFISIFLAFWLNNYQAEQEEKRATQTAKNIIYQELTRNLQSLEKRTAFYNAINNNKKTFKETKLDTISYFYFWGTLDTPIVFIHDILPSGARDLAMDNSIHLHPIAKSNISRIYEEQRLVNDARHKLFEDFLTSREIYDEKKVRENYLIFYDLINNLSFKEKFLISNMKDVIKQIKPD